MISKTVNMARGVNAFELKRSANICTPMFMAALLTIAKIQKQPDCLLINEWIRCGVHTHTHTHTNGILLNCEKELKFAICNNMDGPSGYYAK